jgi:DNA-binding LacI/PurR family transcriptional regulator
VAGPRTDVGRVAFQALNALIANSGEAGREYEIKTSLIVRQTTAPPTAGR